MSLTSPKFFPNGFMKSLVNDGKNYDETTQPVVDPRSLLPGDAIDDSTGTGVASDGQATNLTDNDIQAQLTFDPDDSDTDELLEMEMALTNRDTYDFAFLGLHNIRDAFPAAVNQQVDLLHHTSADISAATAIVPTSMRSGFLGQGLPFQRYNGFNSVTTKSDDPNLNFGIGELTLAGQLRTSHDFSSAEGGILAKGTGAQKWELKITTGNLLRFTLRGAGGAVNVDSDAVVNTGDWVRFACVRFNPGLMIMYINGVAQADTETSPTDTISNANDFLMGALNGPASFSQVDLQDIQLLNRGIDAAEALDRFENPQLYPLVADQWAKELHTDANAMSDPNGNEANATTGWSSSAGIFQSQAVVKDVGSFAMECDDTAGPSDGVGMSKTFTTIIGRNYRISARLRHTGTGTGGWRVDVGGSTVDSILIGETSFRDFIYSFIATSTSTPVNFREDSGISDGGVFVDNFSFKQLGAVAAYLPDGINPDDSKWYDSANGLDGTNTAVIHMQAPTGTDYGFTLALFDAISDQYWFARINEDALTATENARLGQWMMGKSFRPTFNPENSWTEEVGVDGVVLSRTKGGRFMGNRRHGAKLRWTFQWSWLSEDDKALFNKYYATVGGKLFPHLFSPDSDNAEPTYHMVRLMSGNPFTGMGADAMGLTMVLEED